MSNQKYKIPLFKLNFDDREKDALLSTLDSKWISMGPKCSEFESLFAEKIGTKYAVSLSNCTASLHLALKAVGVGKSDEVIVPSLTFVATVNSVRYLNAKPIFCDVTNCNDLTLDTKLIEPLINEKTKAIIVMHYAGYSCDMKKINDMAKKYDLSVIEDACHAPLSEFGNKKLGSIGDIGCFSFFSNKNISTAEGGMLVTDNADIFEKVKLNRSHGMTSLSYDRSRGHSTSYDVIEFGYNYRMDDLRASLGIVQLKKLEGDIQVRSKVRRKYIKSLSGLSKVIIPFKANINKSSNYIFPIVLKDSSVNIRDQIRFYLDSKGIQTSVHYPAVHRFSIYNSNKIKLPVSEYVSDNLITLPMYSSLTNLEVDYICNELSNALKIYHI